MRAPQTGHEKASKSRFLAADLGFSAFSSPRVSTTLAACFRGTPATRSDPGLALAVKFSHDCRWRRGPTHRFLPRAFDVRFSSMKLVRLINAVAFAFRTRDPKAAWGLGRLDPGNDKWKRASFAHQQPHRLPPFPTLSTPPSCDDGYQRTTCMQYCWSSVARSAPHCAMNIFLCSTHKPARR